MDSDRQVRVAFRLAAGKTSVLIVVKGTNVPGLG
jgi:hypothetical protein